MEKMIIFYRNDTEKEWAIELAEKYIPYPTETFTMTHRRTRVDEKNQHTIWVRRFSDELSARGLKADFVLIPKDFDFYTRYFHIFIGITSGSQDAIMFYSDGRD